MLFSHVKISSFRAKAHLVFHWCLYNNAVLRLGFRVSVNPNPKTTFFEKKG